MDTLHSVLRTINDESKADKSRRDHLTVFREFLDHLDRATKRKPTARATRGGKPSRRKR